MEQKRRGDYGVGQAIAYFTKRGYIVSIPLSDSQEYDLIVDNGKISTVQVKTSNCKKDNGYSVELRTRTHARGKQYGMKSLGKVDFVFAVTGDGSMYLIPRQHILAKTCLLINKKMQEFRV